MSTQEVIWPENNIDSQCDFEDIDTNFNLTTLDNVIIPVNNEENIQNQSPIQRVCIIRIVYVLLHKTEAKYFN